MKGIYLNDIPVDLFLKYLTKDNLASQNYEPVPENLTVYIYNFTINSAGSYFYRSIFDSFTHVKPEIVRYFEDFHAGLVEADLGLIDFETELDGKVYYNSTLELAVPYQYYIEIIGSPNIFYYLPEINWGEELAITSIFDSRDNTDLSISGTAVFDSVNNRYNIDDGSSVIGYIYENPIQTVYKKDENGNTIYLDEFGNETTKSSKESIFLKHNQAIRNGFRGITDIDKAIGEKFNNRCVGIVDDRTSKGQETFYFAYYEKYRKTITYTIIDPAAIPSSYSVQYLSRSLLKNLEGTGTYTTTLDTNISKNLLNVNSIPKVQAKRINVVGISDKVYENTDPGFNDYIVVNNEPILVEIFKEVLLFQKSYDVLLDSGLRYISDNIENRRVYIETISSLDYLKIFMSTQTTLKYRDQNNNSITKTRELRNGKYYININGKYYEIISGGVYGFIRVPVKIEKIFIDTYFGKVSEIVSAYSTGKKFCLTKYTFTEPTEYLDEESSSTIYKKDSVDSTIAIQIDGTYERIDPALTYSFNQFLDYKHVPSSSGTIPIQNYASLQIIENISGASSLTELKENFKYNHYLTLGYFKDRGAVVPSNVFRDERVNMIRKMTPEFIEKRYNNFVISDSGVYDIDALLKMRIYAESFQSIIENDYINATVPLTARKSAFLASDVDAKIILSNKLDSSEVILTKKLDDYKLDDYSVEELNPFQRLVEYEKFQNIDSYTKFMIDNILRESIFGDFDQIEETKDFIVAPETNFVQHSPSILEYKNAIVNDLTNNFFKFNYYIEDIDKNGSTYQNINDEFVKNYENFYKDRLPDMSELAIPLEDIISEKKIYSIENLDELDIIQKVLESDWSVL